MCEEYCCCGYMQFRIVGDPNYGDVKDYEEIGHFCYECLREWASEDNYLYEKIVEGEDISGRNLESVAAGDFGHATCLKDIPPRINWNWNSLLDEENS